MAWIIIVECHQPWNPFLQHYNISGQLFWEQKLHHFQQYRRECPSRQYPNPRAWFDSLSCQLVMWGNQRGLIDRLISLIINLGPDCLVGNGQNPNNNGNNARGEYNISIHQNFRLNGTNYYTIFDLPISVTNDIPQEPSSQADSSNPIPGPAGPNDSRIACALLENPVQPYTEQVNSQHTPSVQPYLGGPVVVSGTGTGGSSSSGEIGNTANSDHPSFFGVVLLFVFLLTVVNLWSESGYLGVFMIPPVCSIISN